MFGRAKLPLSNDERLWIDQTFGWLINEFGESTLMARDMILPTGAYFPLPLEPTEESVERFAVAVSEYMEIDRRRFDVAFFDEARPTQIGMILTAPEVSEGAAGYYERPIDWEKETISLNANLLSDPEGLVATLAHELAHIHLLGDDRLSDDDPEHEFITDLLTVFYGLGIFNANTAFRYQQTTDLTWSAWQASQQGYLSEEQFAYALALRAHLRGQTKPAWTRYLASNVRPYFKKSLRWLDKNTPS